MEHAFYLGEIGNKQWDWQNNFRWLEVCCGSNWVMRENSRRKLTLWREWSQISLFLWGRHILIMTRMKSATREKEERFPREGTAHCKDPQGGKIFGSFNTVTRLAYAHPNSQLEIYSCFWKLQRYGFTACRWCRLCPISQNMPAPKRALEMKYMNHILYASQYEQAVFWDPG